MLTINSGAEDVTKMAKYFGALTESQTANT